MREGGLYSILVIITTILANTFNSKVFIFAHQHSLAKLDEGGDDKHSFAWPYGLTYMSYEYVPPLNPGYTTDVRTYLTLL